MLNVIFSWLKCHPHKKNFFQNFFRVALSDKMFGPSIHAFSKFYLL